MQTSLADEPIVLPTTQFDFTILPAALTDPLIAFLCSLVALMFDPVMLCKAEVIRTTLLELSSIEKFQTKWQSREMIRLIYLVSWTQLKDCSRSLQ